MSEYLIITHTDMDGVGSAALYIYLQGEKPSRILFSEPYHLDKVIKRIKADDARNRRIAIMDLGMNPKIMDKIYDHLAELVDVAVSIEWYDHHVWNKEWIKKLEELGLKMNIDRTTCAAGVVAKYAPRNRKEINESFLSEVVGGVCAGDLWRFDHWRGPWYLRLVRRRDSLKWRFKVLEVLSNGIEWTDEFTEKIVERVEVELREYNSIDPYIVTASFNGYKIAVAPSSKVVDNSFLAAYVMGRTGADIVGIVDRTGKLSLRSRRVNIRDLAVRLGGGGHPRAAGALVKMPLLKRLIALFKPLTIVEYTLKVIGDNIDAVSLLEE